MVPIRSLPRLVGVIGVMLFGFVTPAQAQTQVGVGPAAALRAATSSIPVFDHVFIVIMENTSATSIIGNNTQAPYINSLATQNSYSSSYYAITHPSLPNYLALTGASTFGITNDCLPSSCPVNASNIADRIEGSGRTWKAYMESMPVACDTADAAPYAVKHNPFVYYNDIRTNVARCQAHDVPYTQLALDLTTAATTPNYVWITPNMCNDMHDCSIATGDIWLKGQIPSILASPAFTQQNSLLLLTWDEDDFSGNNRVDLVAAGPQVKRGYVSGAGYNHYSMLSTIESAWNLSALNSGTDGSSAPMSDLVGSTAVLPTNCVTASVSAGVGGSPVAVTGGSTGCPNPSYEFWVQPPGGAWSLQQGWGGSNFNWTTSGKAAGTYQVGVWARDSTSSRSYDAYGITTHSIGLDGCTSTSLSPNLAAPQGRGSLVTFSAASTRCGLPEYRFWVLPPGGSWTSVQNYGVGTSWQLDSRLYPAGNVQVGVWARQAGSGNAYDSFFITTFWISPAAGCVVTGLTPGAAAPQAVGATVTFSAQQSGCSQQYRFWLLPPGGSWRSVQAYGASGSWTWNTSGYSSGTY